MNGWANLTQIFRDSHPDSYNYFEVKPLRLKNHDTFIFPCFTQYLLNEERLSIPFEFRYGYYVMMGQWRNW